MQMKPLTPHCDVHPEMPLRICDVAPLARAHRIGYLDNEVAGQCTAPGCERFFWRRIGYQVIGAPLAGSPVCERHDDFLPFLLVQPHPKGGYRYVCPVEGCNESRPWPAGPRTAPFG
jgi:hypothetical protein